MSLIAKRRPTYTIEDFENHHIVQENIIPEQNDTSETNVKPKPIKKRPKVNNSLTKPKTQTWKGQFRELLNEIEMIGKTQAVPATVKETTNLSVQSESNILARTFEVMNSSFQVKNFDEKKLLQGYSKRKYLQQRDSVLSLTENSVISESLSLAEQLREEEEKEEEEYKLSLAQRVKQTLEAHYTVVSSTLVEANKNTARSRVSRLSRISSKRSISSLSQRSTSGFKDSRSKRRSKHFRNNRLSLINEGNDKPEATKIKLGNIQLDFQTQQTKITKLSPYMLPSSSRTNKPMKDADLLPPLSARVSDVEQENKRQEFLLYEGLADEYQRFSKKAEKDISDLQKRHRIEINEVKQNLKGLLESKRIHRASMLFKRKKALDELLKNSNELKLNMKMIRSKTSNLIENEYNSARKENQWFEEIIKRYFAQVTKFSQLDKKLFLGLQQILQDRIIINKDIFKELLIELFKDIEYQTPLCSRVTNYIAFHVVDFEEEEFKDFLVNNSVRVPQRIGKVKKVGNALKMAGGIRALTVAMKLKRNLMLTKPIKTFSGNRRNKI